MEADRRMLEADPLKAALSLGKGGGEGCQPPHGKGAGPTALERPESKTRMFLNIGIGPLGASFSGPLFWRVLKGN